MDLASKSEILKRFEKLKAHYRSETEIGGSIRKGISECISIINQAAPFELFSLKEMGQDDLKTALSKVNKKLDSLTSEPETELLEIEGAYIVRYTDNIDKAKEILKSELELVIKNIDPKFVNEALKIKTISVKKSNLKDYKIEN